LIYLRAGNTTKAISLWGAVFARDPHFVGINLADAECAVGDRKQAIAVLRRLLHFYPDMSEARLRLTAILSRGSECGGGAAGPTE
jgi:Flp pilus assembly protein TadD